MPRTPEDPWLIPFLRRLRVRPGMYLYAQTVRALDTYLVAYEFGRTDLGHPAFGRGEENLLRDFESWLERKLGTRDSRGWWGLVEDLDGSQDNIHTFLRLFDEFLIARGERPLSEEQT